MSEVQFKTIEECDVSLVSYTKSHHGADMDRMPAHAARVSFGNEADERTEGQDRKLMQYLADHQHTTPFEYQHATFMIECPLFIRSQIHRHRTFSFNEISRRYTSDDLGFWTPTTWRKQAENNKQGSDGVFALDDGQAMSQAYRRNVESIVTHYEMLLYVGVAREQARAILPQSLLTRFYMGGNLRNWAHFLELRLDSHAQYEVRSIAERIHAALKAIWPHSTDVLVK